MISWKNAVKAYQHWQARGQYLQADAIRGLMIHALARRERKAYDLIKKAPNISTAELGRIMHVSNQNAWEVCRNLQARYLVSGHHSKGSLRWILSYDLPTTNT